MPGNCCCFLVWVFFLFACFSLFSHNDSHLYTLCLSLSGSLKYIFRYRVGSITALSTLWSKFEPAASEKISHYTVFTSPAFSNSITCVESVNEFLGNKLSLFLFAPLFRRSLFKHAVSGNQLLVMLKGTDSETASYLSLSKHVKAPLKSL